MKKYYTIKKESYGMYLGSYTCTLHLEEANGKGSYFGKSLGDSEAEAKANCIESFRQMDIEIVGASKVMHKESKLMTKSMWLRIAFITLALGLSAWSGYMFYFAPCDSVASHWMLVETPGRCITPDQGWIYNSDEDGRPYPIRNYMQSENLYPGFQGE